MITQRSDREVSTFVNGTEEFVFNVCQKTALSLWCYANPLAAPGKELCDIMMVCDPHIIVVSVKDIRLNVEKEMAGYQRWIRKAVDDSVKQIYGAERVLTGAASVIRKDGTPGLALPLPASRKVYRIAVAFGSKGEVPLASGDFGKGFVHVMNEQGLFDVLNELDTVTDFVNYLAAKEDLTRNSKVVVNGAESNLLGWYLLHERSFSQKPGILVIEDDIWKNLSDNPLFKERKKADSESYRWDALIESLADPRAKSLNGPEPNVNDFDVALREMARETRFARRTLGRQLQQFLGQATARKIRARAINGERGVIYVLVFFRSDEEERFRVAELMGRCKAARLKIGHGHTVIGVGIGEYKEGVGSTSDLVYIQMDDWTPVEQDEALRNLGFFGKSEMRNVHEDEYPKPAGA
jgi:hypothetical protein